MRIVNRAWRATWTLPALLNPLRFGWFSLELISHKLLRWLMPVLLRRCAAAQRAAASSARRCIVAAGRCSSCSTRLALAGYLTRGRPTHAAALCVPYYFCLVNIASARGIIEAYRGRTYTTWATPRATSKPR